MIIRILFTIIIIPIIFASLYLTERIVWHFMKGGPMTIFDNNLFQMLQWVYYLGADAVILTVIVVTVRGYFLSKDS